MKDKIRSYFQMFQDADEKGEPLSDSAIAIGLIGLFMVPLMLPIIAIYGILLILVRPLKWWLS